MSNDKESGFKHTIIYAEIKRKGFSLSSARNKILENNDVADTIYTFFINKCI